MKWNRPPRRCRNPASLSVFRLQRTKRPSKQPFLRRKKAAPILQYKQRRDLPIRLLQLETDCMSLRQQRKVSVRALEDRLAPA
jgi:hypothetical protein